MSAEDHPCYCGQVPIEPMMAARIGDDDRWHSPGSCGWESWPPPHLEALSNPMRNYGKPIMNPEQEKLLRSMEPPSLGINEVLVPNHPEFKGGGVREAAGDRPRFELLVPEGVPYEDQILTRFAVHMAKGAEKYASRNWEEFSDKEAYERAVSSAFRHLMQWMTGVEDGEDHASAIMFNVMCAEHIKGKEDRNVSERQPW